MSSSTNEELSVYTSVGITADVPVRLHPGSPDDQAVAMMFGDERLMLEFTDVAVLEQVRDLADEGARRLAAAIAREAATS